MPDTTCAYVSQGAALIAAERRRQVDVERWSPERDAQYRQGELLLAARSYLSEGEFHLRYPDVPFDPAQGLTIQNDRGFSASTWPWTAEWWRPSEDPVRNLVKAGALIAAEIDRLTASGDPVAEP